MPEHPVLDPADMKEAEKSYNAFLPQAMALPATEIVPFRTDALLAYHNVKRGADAVLARKIEVSKHFDPQDLTLLDQLSSVALGVVFAASQVNRMVSRSSGEIGEKLVRAREIRGIMLPAAQSCAAAKLIPEADVEKIYRGRGSLDTAQDCIDLAALYRKYSTVLENKTPASPALIDEAATLGTELVTLIKPASVPKEKTVPQAVKDAADKRDRLFTLLVRGHEKLWQTGAILFGKKVDDHVPPLQSRTR